VSRVYYIRLSVTIRNWRSAISAYYRITFLGPRLLAFMTFFYSLDFFLSFLHKSSSCCAAAERSLFIHIRWQTMEFFPLYSTYRSFSLFVLYLPFLLLLLLLVVVIVNENYRRLFFFTINVLNNKLMCVRVRKKRREFDA
jgi:hypothetical protein